MKTPALRILVLGLCLSPLPIGAGTGMQVEEANAGGRRISLIFDDSVTTPALSSLRVDGYGIEAAAFVEESDSLSLSPDLWDLTLPGTPHLLQRDNNDSQSFLLEVPPDWTLRPGLLLTDTALGGVLAKVLSFAPSSTANQYWVKTQPAFLNDVILEGEIRFKMRMDLNTMLSDQHFEGSITNPDSGTVEWEGNMRNAKMLFQPVLTGVLRVHNGLLEKMAFHLQGAMELDGSFDAAVQGAGRFTHSDSLPESNSFAIPLGHGLCLWVTQRFSLGEEAAKLEDSLVGRADNMRVKQNVDADLEFNYNRWQPAADVHENSTDKLQVTVQGKGSFGWSLQPQIEFSLGAAAPGPVLTISPTLRVAAPPADLAAPDSAAPSRATGLAWLHDVLFLDAPPVSAIADPARDFLLFNRERIWISPPLQGWAEILGGDSSSVVLQGQTEPSADYFIIQRLMASGTWETFLPRATGSRIRLSGLRSGVEQHFRLIGVNASGAGTAFPPGGLSYMPPVTQPLPLIIPTPVMPDTEARSDSGVWLTWNVPATNPPPVGTFNVYLGPRFSHLEPVAQSLRDTAFYVPHLDSGRTYFWKIEYVEGARYSEGPVRWFTYSTLHPAHPTAQAPPKIKGMVYLPGGGFKRSDGNTVVVGPFYIQPYEVMQKDYRRIMGDNPSFNTHDSLPVERVTWDEADQYCREVGGRLPTEAEWEFAARGGVSGSYYWGDAPATEYAHFRDNSSDHTWPVGSLKPNAYGLYDMAGNVFEWTHDWYGDYSPEDLLNPKGPPTGDAKVIRGGSWYSEGQSLDLSARFSNRPGFRNYKVGFRCAETAPAAALAGSGR